MQGGDSQEQEHKTLDLLWVVELHLLYHVPKNIMVQHGPQVELYQLQDMLQQVQEHKTKDLFLVVGRHNHVPKSTMVHHGPQVDL